MTIPPYLNIVSWNVRGLRKLVKIKQVLARIKHIQAKIVYIQETHLLSDEMTRIRRRWPGQVIASCHSSQARGVAVLIHKSVPFRTHKIILDPMGRFVIVKGSLINQDIILANILYMVPTVMKTHSSRTYL